MKLFLSILTLVLCLGIDTNGFASEVAIGASNLYEKVLPSTCAILSLDSEGEEVGFGSGFVISTDGKIVTNAHVVAGAIKVAVECNYKKGTVSKIIAYKEGIDLVVVQSSLKNTAPLDLLSRDKIKPGGLIFAIGNPLGLQGTITSGLYSGVRRYKETDYLQISASINPGNSGGPVMTNSADVIGIATMSLADTQGLNFPVPADEIPKLPKVNLEISSLNIYIENEEYEKTSPIVSGLSFLGLPLGSDCLDIQKIKGIFDIEGNAEREGSVVVSESLSAI